MKRKKLLLTIFIAIIAVAGLYFLTQKNRGPYSQFNHITTKGIFTQNVNNNEPYYVYFYRADCSDCSKIEDLISNFAKENNVFFINTKEDSSDNKISSFDWSKFNTENDIEIGTVDKNNNIVYYDGESKEKYTNCTETNQFGKTKKYEIVIADEKYLETNKNARIGYAYASLLTPEIDYSNLGIHSSVELAGVPTLLKIDGYSVEDYYYDVEDITNFINSLN